MSEGGVFVQMDAQGPMNRVLDSNGLPSVQVGRRANQQVFQSIHTQQKLDDFSQCMKQQMEKCMKVSDPGTCWGNAQQYCKK